MSGALPSAAPLDEPDDGSPVGESPELEEVVAESHDDGKFVSVERFNGLMSSFNKTQNRVKELEAELASRPNPVQVEDNPLSDEVTALTQQVQTLLSMLNQREQGSALEAALRDYPEAAPFADLIRGDTAEEMRDVARVLHERVTGLKGGVQTPPAATQDSAPPAAPPVSEPPVLPGGGSVSDVASLREQVNEAIKRRDFSAAMAAKFALQQAQEGALD